MFRLSNVLVIATLGAGLYCGCATDSDLAQPLHADLEVFDIGSDTPLGMIRSIVHHDDVWLLCDDRAKAVWVVENDLMTLRRTIGRSGQGPGELEGCSSLSTTRDSIYVYDARMRRLQLFHPNGDAMRHFALDRFTTGIASASDGMIFGSPDFSTPPLVRIGHSGLIEKRFGTLLASTDSDVQNQLASRRHVRMLEDGLLLTAGMTYPVVEVLDTTGQVIRGRDLADLPMFHNAVHEAQTRWLEEGIENLTVTSIKDVAVLGEHVFLLVWEGKKRHRHLLVLDLTDFEPMGYYELHAANGEPLEWAYSMAASPLDRRVLVFDGVSAGMYAYDLADQPFFR